MLNRNLYHYTGYMCYNKLLLNMLVVWQITDNTYYCPWRFRDILIALAGRMVSSLAIRGFRYSHCLLGHLRCTGYCPRGLSVTSRSRDRTSMYARYGFVWLQSAWSLFMFNHPTYQGPGTTRLRLIEVAHFPFDVCLLWVRLCWKPWKKF